MKNSKFHFVIAALAAGFCFFGVVNDARSHCQIPCGIYDDAARFVSMREHVKTIEKSMTELAKLRSAGGNQAVRWVLNKEQHADELSEIVTYYFMTQRIKVPKDFGNDVAVKKYVGELALLHQMLVFSMKAKQTTDVANVKKLRELIDKFEASYMVKKGASLQLKKKRGAKGQRVPYVKRLANVR